MRETFGSWKRKKRVLSKWRIFYKTKEGKDNETLCVSMDGLELKMLEIFRETEQENYEQNEICLFYKNKYYPTMFSNIGKKPVIFVFGLDYDIGLD
jgi:hypothetical protein